MIKINDVMMSPDGPATVLYKNRNGIIKLRIGETDHFVHKTKVEKFPLIHRPREKPPQKEPLYSYGLIGNGPYRSVVKGIPTGEYRTWRAMLQRVYMPTATAYTGVTICAEWHDFQNFAAWYHRQIDDRPGGVKWVLDMRLYDPENTDYRPDVCCMVPQQVHATMSFKRANRDLPLGVTQNRNSPWLSVTCGGRLVGQYISIDDAKSAYWSAKMSAIRALGVRFWSHLPEPLALRLLRFDWPDAARYFPSEFE